jgi:hypothetical protein
MQFRLPGPWWNAASMKKPHHLSQLCKHATKPKKQVGQGATQIALQSNNTEDSKQIFTEKELHGHSPNFHIHVSVSDLYIPTIDLPIVLQEIGGLILGIYTRKSLTDA